MTANEASKSGQEVGGPIDDGVWPSQLPAHVVDPGPPARIRGYDVEADLAKHYRYPDVLRLALAGELPSDAVSRAFDVALQLLAPSDVTAAPAHAAVLARICGARTSALIGIAAVTLAEQARHVVAEHAALLAWLNIPSGAFPAAFVAAGPADVRAVEALRAALAEAGLEVAALVHGPTRLAALLATLHACGLTEAEHLEAVLVLAQLPCVLGEAFAAKAGAFQHYPMRVPPFRHEVAR
jgi:hypothetical protein